VQPTFLEHALFVDELRPESAAELQQLARQLWRTAVLQATQAATEKVEQDKGRGFIDAPEMRVRFGAYFYAEPKLSPEPPLPDTTTAE
jgi:hypothetical protein